MISLSKLIKEFEEQFPRELAEEWDNVGILVGDIRKKVNKVMLCLDITREAVDFAVNEKVDLIISHHPFILKGQKKILSDNVIGSKIIDVIKNDIVIYSAHTNVDAAKGGLNEYILEKMNLEGEMLESELIALRRFNLKEKKSIEDIIGIIKENLKIKNVRLSRAMDNKMVRKIAVTTGSGDSFISLIRGKVDLFITGDLKHHISLDMGEENLHLLDIDHYGSEKIVVELFEKKLKEIDNEIEIIRFDSKEVFEYL
ncbi:Nif3-like dinuclear metal center hexameric protein [Streptobacillus notomytis]|uniref:Nif3-like dinuclear metal center hexameric protein n=1 Tax=Streptobacillus notomytis TaxID=1712031 RepID=UPI000936D3D3|nr:Nif3-like dinuclear metal center hexameric protein [Streptobacillus notomytis]